MLTKLYLKPLIKRYRHLFITMCVLSIIGVASIVAFGGVAQALHENFEAYVETSNTPDGFVSTNYFLLSDEIKTKVNNIEGIESYTFDAFLPISTYIEKKSETKSSQLYTFDMDQKYKPTIVDKITYDTTLPNVYVEYNFASENNITSGDKLKIGYYDESIEVYVAGTIKFPDTLKYGPTNETASNNTNFGRIYMEKDQLTPILDDLLVLIENKFGVTDVAVKGVLANIKDAFDTEKYNYGNRFSIYVKDGYDINETVNELRDLLENENSVQLKIIDCYSFTDSAIATFIESNFNMFSKFGMVVGLTIFLIMILVITLFLNQILKDLIRDVGIMRAIGFEKEKIFLLLALFSFIVSIVGSILGVVGGYFLERALDVIVAGIFKYPLSVYSLKFIPILIGVAATIIVNQLATFFSVQSLVKLTPVEALQNASEGKKVFSDRFDKALQKATPNVKLTINTIVTKPKRFITSFVAVLSTFFIIFLALTFRTSYNVALDQTFKNCLNYDTQIILSSQDPSIEQDLINLGVGEVEKVKYAKVTLEHNGKSFESVMQGLKVGTNKIIIPKKFYDSNPLPSDGVVVNKNIAKLLDVKEGDVIKVDGHNVQVKMISNFEVYPLTLCNIEHLDEYANSSFDSYFVDGIEKETLVNYMTNHHYDSLINFKDDIKTYFTANFAPTQSVTVIFLIIAVLVGGLIVALMMQTSLTEQKRQICVMRSIGFGMGQISFLWSIQSFSQFILAVLIGTPLGIWVGRGIFNILITRNSCVTAYITSGNVLLTYAIVLTFMFIAHNICMFFVQKWNIAINTKDREG